MLELKHNEKGKGVSMNNNEMHEAKKLRRKFFRLTNRYTRIGNRYDAIEEYIRILKYDIETIKDIKNAKLVPITPHLVLEICRDQRMNLYDLRMGRNQSEQGYLR